MFKSKVGKFLCAFFMPLILLYIAFAIVGIYPFGAKTFFSGDLEGQYVYYFSYLHEMLHGNADWAYTFSKTLGGNMTDMISYYLASPFNLIFFFLDESSMPFAVFLLSSLKLGCMSLAFYWFISKKLGEKYSLILFSTMYAMSGYVVCYQFEYMWMDGVILLPFLIYLIEKFDTGKKYRRIYALVLTLGIVTNYYIGYMLCGMCAIYFVVYRLFIQDKMLDFKKGIKVWFRFAFRSVTGGMLSAFILVPTVFALRGAKMGDMSLKQFVDFRLLFSPITAFVQMLPFTYESGQLDRYIPVLYCGTITLICCLLYFVGKDKLKKKIGYLIVLLVLLCSTFFAGINSVWHGFASPTGYPSRFSFMNVFFVLYVGALFLDSCKIVISKKWITPVLGVVLFAEASLNAAFIYSNMNFQSIKAYNENVAESKETEAALDELALENDINFYRIVDGGLNTAWRMNKASVNSYTSCEQVDSRNFLNSLGLGSNNCWNSYYAGNTPELLLPLLSIKYQITDTTKENENDTRVYSGEKVVIYEKEAVLPLGYFVDESIEDVELEGTDCVQILKGIWDAVDNSSKTEIASELEIPENFFEQAGENVTINFPDIKDMIIYLDFDGERILTCEGTKVAEVNQWNKTANILDGSKEYVLENITIAEIREVRLYSFDRDEMTRRVEKNQTRSDLKADINVINGSHIEIQTTNETGKGQNLLFSLPKERRSWKVYIDGEQLSIDALTEGFGNLMMYEVPEGSHTITMEYETRGTKAGIILSILGIVLMLF